MSYKVLYALWGGLFALCAGLGFVSEPQGVLKWCLQALTVVFFLPGCLILLKANREDNRHHRAVVRNLCLGSLGATVVLFALNLMSVGWSELMGNVLYAALVVVSSPMVCGGGYVLSLFLWGCLLMAALSPAKPKKIRDSAEK